MRRSLRFSNDYVSERKVFVAFVTEGLCCVYLWNDNVTMAVLPMRRRDCDLIMKKSRLLVAPSVRSGTSPTSATTML
jgi:hypothetical protein